MGGPLRTFSNPWGRVTARWCSALRSVYAESFPFSTLRDNYVPDRDFIVNQRTRVWCKARGESRFPCGRPVSEGQAWRGAEGLQPAPCRGGRAGGAAAPRPAPSGRGWAPAAAAPAELGRRRRGPCERPRLAANCACGVLPLASAAFPARPCWRGPAGFAAGRAAAEEEVVEGAAPCLWEGGEAGLRGRRNGRLLRGVLWGVSRSSRGNGFPVTAFNVLELQQACLGPLLNLDTVAGILEVAAEFRTTDFNPAADELTWVLTLSKVAIAFLRNDSLPRSLNCSQSCSLFSHRGIRASYFQVSKAFWS